MSHKIIWMGKARPLADQNLVMLNIDNIEFWGNLPLYIEEENHSPTGFSWGYNGSGPSQLAYAILRSYFVISEKLSIPEAVRKAKNLHMRFKRDFVAKWDMDGEWTLESDKVGEWVSTQKIEYEGWV